MKISKLTRKCKILNEDRFIVGKDFYIVIDGATPLIKKDNINLANYMVAYIKKNINKFDGRIIARLERLASDLFKELNLDSDDPAYLPSASLSVVEKINGKYYASVLGDCEVVFKTKSNEIIRINRTDLNRLDSVAIEEMVSIAKEKSIDVLKARTYVQETLIKNRRMINKDNGYSGYTIGENIVLSPLTYEIDEKYVQEIYLYSDGFSSLFTQFHLYENCESLFKNNIDIKEEVKKIINLADSDKECNKYPRFKKIDDITIIKIINE